MIVQSDSIERYNDDFALYVPSAGSRYADTNFTGVGVIDDSLDWSISFFCYRETRGTGILWDNRGGVASNQPKGVELIFDDSNPNYSFRFRTGLGSSQTEYYFSDYKYKVGYIYHTVLTFNSTTKDLTQYVNSVEVQTLNTTGNDPIDCTTVTYSRFLSFSGSYAGALKQCFIRDFSVYSKELNSQEINYVYETGVPPTSAYANIQHYYPLNQVPYESGGNYFMKDVADSYNNSATTSDVELTGWTADELGLGVGGLPASTTYRGWESKTNYIPSGDYTKGLNFDSSKQQYLEITGLEAFDISEGYTTVLGWQRVDNVLPSSAETMMGSDTVNGNYTIQFIQNSRDLGLYHESGFVAESGISLDLSNRNLTTFISGSAREITNAYSSVKDTRQGYRNGKITCSDNSITTLLGFDIIFSSGAKMYLGRRNSSGRYYTGKLSYCTIVKGRLTQEQIKTIHNNGLYRSVYEVIEDTSKVMLDVDFINPFLDGSDVKFPDNSGNCVVTAKQNTGTDWTTLGGVQASID